MEFKITDPLTKEEEEEWAEAEREALGQTAPTEQEIKAAAAALASHLAALDDFYQQRPESSGAAGTARAAEAAIDPEELLALHAPLCTRPAGAAAPFVPAHMIGVVPSTYYTGALSHLANVDNILKCARESAQPFATAKALGALLAGCELTSDGPEVPVFYISRCHYVACKMSPSGLLLGHIFIAN